MKLIASVLFAAAASLTLSGCPSTTVQDGAAAAGAADPAAPDEINATTAQCRAERQLLEMAIETYTILNDGPPLTEAELVPGWLRIESIYMDIDAAGNVVPSPASGCT